VRRMAGGILRAAGLCVALCGRVSGLGRGAFMAEAADGWPPLWIVLALACLPGVVYFSC